MSLHWLRIGVVALGLLLAPAALAQGTGPVKVTADDFVVDQGAGQAVFSGNVVVKRADLTLEADRVEVEYADGTQTSIRNIIATGHVRLTTDSQKATSERAQFDPSSQVLRLAGNVTVVDAQGTVSGGELVVDLEKRTTTFSSGKGGRVTGVFTPP